MSGRDLVLTSHDAPALIDQAEQALALISDHDEAETYYRYVSALEHAAKLARVHGEMQLRVGKLRLRAERRWGELLGPAEQGGDRRSDQVTAGDLKSTETSARHKARKVSAVPEDVFEAYLAMVKDPELLRRARLLRVGREKSPPVEPATVTTLGTVEIRHGDLRTVLDDLAGQVDAIITDPPYPAEFLDEFDALGDLAKRILKPGGLMVAMVGQTHLPEYLRRLGAHLPYRWCGAYLTSGPATRVFGRKVGTKWKPLLIFGGTEFITQDVFASVADDKKHHHWGQSESGMADIVSRLTSSGQLIVDPFLGGGTTAVVCRDLGRRFVGCDVDGSAVSSSLERLAA